MTPLPGLHEILRAAAPPERPCVAGVAVFNVSPDRRDAGVKRVEDRVPQPLPRQLREEPLGAKREVAFIHDAEVGVKWNVQSGWPFSHSRTSADLWDETLSRMTCTGVPESIPSAPLSATRSRGPRSPSDSPVSRPSASLPFCWLLATAAGGQCHAFERNGITCFKSNTSFPDCFGQISNCRRRTSVRLSFLFSPATQLFSSLLRILNICHQILEYRLPGQLQTIL